jgi:serine phosphatase RsbU (regulator of sigma subunit)
MGHADDRVPRPAELGPMDGVDLHAHYHADRIGGDFFDATRVGTRAVFLLSDIAGKRPQTDMLAAAMQEAFRVQAPALFGAVDANIMEGTEMLVQALNHALIDAAKEGVRFAPTLVGCFDTQLGLLAYINAGGQTALLHDSDGVHTLPNPTPPLGLTTHLTYEASMQAFEPGARLLVVTKGVTHTIHGKLAFGEAGVTEVLRGSHDAPASAMCEAVLDAAHGFEKKRRFSFGRDERDDMTALAVVRARSQG